MKEIREAARIMKKGGVVIYPTESSYALGCDATSVKTIRKLHKIKGRNSGKYFPVIVADIEMAKLYYFVDKKTERIAKLGITIVTKKKSALPKAVGGFRISKNRIARNLSKALGRPIIATSANISGKKSLYNADEIKKVFYGKVDAIINAGNLPNRMASTVYDYKKKAILRKGPVSLKRIKSVIS